MKKIIAVLLALVLCFSSLSVVAFAADSSGKSYPRIYVHGFMSRDLLADKNNPYSEVLWPPSSDKILDAVKRALPSIAKFAVTYNWTKLGKEITPIAREIFEPAFLDENGNPKGESGVFFIYPSPEYVRKAGRLSFSYDWRLDPIEIAEQLNDFIDYVLECTGAEKVDLQCHSFGGVVTTTYVRNYGVSKLHSVVYNSTAIFGETYTGELMTGQLVLDKNAVQSFLEYIFDHNEYEHLLNALIDMLQKAGLLGFVCRFGNELVKRIGDMVLPEVIVPAFGGWLSVWSMVPNADIDNAMNYVFNEVYKNSDIDRSGLITKIESFNSSVRPVKEDVLNSINDNTNFYVMSRYGYCSIPITPSWKNVGDGVIDTKYTSFGATCADFDGTLSEEYLAGKDKSMISPDKRIDASTCMFPNQTWFIRGANHNEDLDDITDILFNYDGQATVDTFKEIPRFMYFDADADTFVPDEGPEPELSFLEEVKLVFKEFRALMKMLSDLIRSKLNTKA